MVKVELIVGLSDASKEQTFQYFTSFDGCGSGKFSRDGVIVGWACKYDVLSRPRRTSAPPLQAKGVRFESMYDGQSSHPHSHLSTNISIRQANERLCHRSNNGTRLHLVLKFGQFRMIGENAL